MGNAGRAGGGRLLVVTGPPGAGKSTVARLLADRVGRSVLVEGDAFFAFLAAGAIAPWLPESNDQNTVVTEAAAAATARFVTAGYETVYDGVLGPWFLPTFLAATGLTGLDYAVLLPPLAACLDGVRRRVGHGFTDEAATRKMHVEFAAVEIDARHVFRERPLTAEALADLVAERRAAGALAVP